MLLTTTVFKRVKYTQSISCLKDHLSKHEAVLIYRHMHVASSLSIAQRCHAALQTDLSSQAVSHQTNIYDMQCLVQNRLVVHLSAGQSLLHVHLAAGVLSYIGQTSRVFAGQPSQLVSSCSYLSIPVSKLLSVGRLLYNSINQSINQPTNQSINH